MATCFSSLERGPKYVLAALREPVNLQRARSRLVTVANNIEKANRMSELFGFVCHWCSHVSPSPIVIVQMHLGRMRPE